MASNKKHQADITSVRKVGEGYEVTGTSKGKRVSFFTHSTDIDSRSRDSAREFMRRSISNLADNGKEG
jgi:hypothetical protein